MNGSSDFSFHNWETTEAALRLSVFVSTDIFALLLSLTSRVGKSHLVLSHKLGGQFGEVRREERLCAYLFCG